MSFSQSLSIGLHPFLSWSPSSDKNHILRKLSSSSSNISILLGSLHPVPKCGRWIPSEEHPMFPSMLFWSLLQMSVTKGMGPVMLKPHIMSTLVPLYRSTPLRPKTSGASVSPNSCRALTLKKGYSSPTVHVQYGPPSPLRLLGSPHRTYLRSC